MDRRKAGDDAYRAKFDESGLSDHFEFIERDWNSDHGKKVTARCKACGSVFTGWGPSQYFKGKQSRVICPECGHSSDGQDVWERSPECQEAMAFYSAGHSVRETATRYGVSVDAVQNAARYFGVSNGKDWRKAAADNNRRRHEDAIARRETVRIAKDAEKQRKADERTAQERERLRQLELARIEKKKIREQERRRAEAEKADALFYMLNNKEHICIECGRHFSILEFMKSKGRKLIPTDPKYCSKKCYRKAVNRAKKGTPYGRTGNYYDRARKHGCEYVPGITLKKLIKRNGLKCAICGGMCDLNDHTWSAYSGPMYPSIDHIVPMAKGGGHTWDNVQIAHIICNSHKGDSTEEGLEYDAG